ncbi:MAG TPA: PDC sensor domain-containing protein [Thermoanaerobaculia bacterium]|nr:PDC sensor domain-containing protein [Thermoanaerobaculia bacterium]
MRVAAFAAAIFACLAAAAQTPASRPPAGELDPAIQAEVEQLRSWAQHAAIVGAVRDQNALNVPLSRIRSIDISWMSATQDNSRVQVLLKNPCAKALQGFTARRPGYREAFVMDNQGALVGTTRKTSDYWQGDEDKWRMSFAEGRGAVYASEPQLDDSAGVRLIHVSVPVMDGGKAIGVLTAGIEADLLQRRGVR